jgi:Zn-dependent protease
MSLHEAMHGFVAHWLGDPTAQNAGRLTLNPLKHIDLFTTILLPIVLISLGAPPIFAAKPVPFNPNLLKYDEFGMALVGVAGPLTNLLLAVIASLIFRSIDAKLHGVSFDAFILFIETNVAFFIFNMIPFPPLDGSRLLYAFAPEGLQEVMMKIEGMGFMSVLVFILIIFQFASGFIINIETGLLNILIK